MHSLRIFSVGAVAMMLGCGGDDVGSATSGKNVVLRTAITIDAASKTQFTTNFGWKVTLEKAAVAVGALYYFDGQPAFTQRAPSLLQRVGSFFEGTAYAHPGHYQAGDALGQMLSPSSYDLFSGSVGALPDGNGVSGTFRSGRFVFAQQTTGPAAAELGTHVAYARGFAEKADGTTPASIHFEVVADYTDVAAQATMAEVDGCTFTEQAVDADGTVMVTLSPSVWFNVVDFTEVAAGTAAAPTVIEKTSKAGIGFVNGLTQLDAYKFAYAP